jgi:MFS transporter, ACS family, hexuronate transporter
VPRDLQQVACAQARIIEVSKRPEAFSRLKTVEEVYMKMVEKTGLASEDKPTSAGQATTTGIVGRVGYYRWGICALLFFAATINYIDRQVIGILKPALQTEIGWTEIEYSWIVFSFQAAYAIGLLVVGGFMDWLGTRKGFSLSIVFWSIAAMGHALASTVMGFAAARFLLGLGEAGNFPASIKTVAEWFPKRERSFATGIFNSGTNIGALVTPIVVPYIADAWGWRWAFILTGAIGFIWLFFWLALYRSPNQHPKLSKAELAHIQSDPPDPAVKIPWLRLLPHRQTWAFALGKFLTDPVWWVYLFWLPDFLNKKHGLSLKEFGPPLVAIYLIADIGSIGGGWLSSALIKRGWSVNAGRKTAMLICALCVVPIVFASQTSNLWVAVILIGIAAAAHQGWSANIFTLVSDTFPRQAVGSVVGIGGMAGAVGGMLIARLVGEILERTGSYVPIFIIAGSAYLFALLVIHLLAPKLEPAALEGVTN